jgi:hypothetical protein
MRDEQTIPETTATFSGRKSSCASALVSEERTEKSPQPGHHTGLIPDLNVCGVTGAAAGLAVFMRDPIR